MLLPFLPLTAVEAGQDLPKRLVLLFSANGTVYSNWLPSGGEQTFSLSTILEPLEPWREQLLVLGGLRTGRNGDGPHSPGNGVLWTGCGLVGGGGWATGPSVDQFIAQRAGNPTLYPSLEFGVQCGQATNSSRNIYAGLAQPVHPEENPYTMFDRMFGASFLDDEERERIRAERRSVIDVLVGEIDRLEARLGSEERHKMEAHLEGIREVERRLDLEAFEGAGCEVPTIGNQIDINANDSFPAVVRLQTDLLVLAMACDITRIASMQWSRGLSSIRFNWLGIGTGHHDLSHYSVSDTSAQNQLTAINRWYAGEVAYLLERLASIPEGDGTMLDNTLVVWGNELGRGDTHSHHPVPFVMAGNVGGHFRTGRFLDYGDAMHNRLLVSICQAMGLDEAQTFGDPDDGSGPLPGLT